MAIEPLASDPWCIDCVAEYKAEFGENSHPSAVGKKPRPVPHGGPRSPRCVTHWREKKKRDKDASHARRTLSVYTLPIDEYHQLKEFQGGKCAICQRATGATRRLAVDHDHTCCPGKTSCGTCVRGLLCGPCNSLLAHIRDDPRMLLRAMSYINCPPFKVMKGWNDDDLPAVQG